MGRAATRVDIAEAKITALEGELRAENRRNTS